VDSGRPGGTTSDHGAAMSRPLADAVAHLLRDHGPLPDDLHALALAQGVTKARTPSGLRSSLTGPRFVTRPDGRVDAAERLLQGQVFTTRPRPGLRDGVLWTSRDLDALSVLGQLPLSTGGALRAGLGGVESWVGPPGWLPTTDGELLGLVWDGRAVHVTVVADVLPGDSAEVRHVREVLGRHARAEHRYGWSAVPRTPLAGTVLSALVEDPDLFRQALPPLRELLPLPEDLRPWDCAPGQDPDLRARIVEVPLSLRVHGELARRADLLGERLPDYLSLLLGAAADRVQLAPRRYEGYEPYDAPFRPLSDDVVQLGSWRLG
jgi:hypothetical protein